MDDDELVVVDGQETEMDFGGLLGIPIAIKAC
jgi:hypothetical protein